MRAFRTDDAAGLARLFHASVHGGTGRWYDARQREAWCPGVPEEGAWRARLEAQRTFVAERGDRPVGFMTLQEDGYIDLAFVAPDRLREGIGTALHRAVEEAAVAAGIRRLHANVSDAARSFFLKHGWEVIRVRTIERDGVELTNSAMQKTPLATG